VHAQSGRRIDLYNATVLLFKRLQDRFANHIDATYVDAHHLRCGNGARSDFGMHVIGDIGSGATRRQIGVVAQDDAATFFGD